MPPELAPTVVIDTNIALDLLVFKDPATPDLLAALQTGQVRWIATAAMRDELERVLGYPKLAARIAFHQCDTPTVLAAMDALCQRVDPAPKAPVTCPDADDQKFIDLACAHRAPLLSKDCHITHMRKRLAALGVCTSVTWNGLVA
ncbi:MAG: putative toxin-antitoxin system toxin component, PIN family [Hydrogenophaga sp.]|nr:putative toxin-antitoxin system toxin component, PIN family [Hydrogenophaga sp.]